LSQVTRQGLIGVNKGRHRQEEIAGSACYYRKVRWDEKTLLAGPWALFSNYPSFGRQSSGAWPWAGFLSLSGDLHRLRGQRTLL
jgi:hypothetical protein